jgi:hypothetical protein
MDGGGSSQEGFRGNDKEADQYQGKRAPVKISIEQEISMNHLY